MNTDQKQMRIRIRRDEDPINWREEGDPVGHIVYTSTRYVLGDERVDDPLEHIFGLLDDDVREEIEEKLDEMEQGENETGEQWLSRMREEREQLINEAFDKAYVSLPVYAYIHSGITVSTGPFSCPWDSGQCGIIYARRDLEEFGGDEDKIRACLQAEIKEFDRYLRGDIWGFEVYSVSTCDHGHEHEEVEDSCWGFDVEDEDDAVEAIGDHVGDVVTEQQIREAWENRQ